MRKTRILPVLIKTRRKDKCAMKFVPNTGILEIAPYVAGESKASGSARIIKLSSNENPFGPSPKSLVALKNAALHLEHYPDANSTDLRTAIAAKFGLEQDRIVCGAGSDEIIGLVCKAYLSPGDEVIYSTHAFLMYGIYAKTCGAKCIEVAEQNLKPDLSAMCAAVTDKTKIVFVTNPNNPTGSFNSPAEIWALRDKLPPHVLLVIDDAYAEYAAIEDGYENGFALAKGRDDVVVLRTFSKIYGLAGLRLGYGYCPSDVADILNRVRGPFNVTMAAQVAGLAALSDDDFIAKSVAHNARMREWTKSQLEGMGLKVYPSAGNFLLVEFADADLAESARQNLKENGILVRQMGAYKLPCCLRISIGAQDDMHQMISTLKNFLESQGSK
jgi:histidinol-phosphate aminotransferase